MTRVLVASPVRQHKDILEMFLRSLDRLKTENMTVEFAFVDDNLLPESSNLLGEFVARHPGSVVLSPPTMMAEGYAKDEVTHRWTSAAMNRVGLMKDEILDYARRNRYDSLLLVDSDLVLHPMTLSHLLGTGKDVISEVFWTRWQPNAEELPQVWVSGQYELFEKDPAEQLSPDVVRARIQAFLTKLRTPGVYEVGGLGACTLLTERALALPLSFEEIPNVSYIGEDRHFCIRAAVLGLQLWVDTHFPAFHIYRLADLTRARSFFDATEYEELDRVAREAVSLFGCLGAGMKLEEESDLLEPALRQHLQRLKALQGISMDAGKSELTIERVQVYSVDGVRGTARARLWVANEGFDTEGWFHERAVANVGLRWSSGRWRASDVQWIPIGTDEEAEGSRIERSKRQSSVHVSGRVRLALAMVVQNDADRYLRRVLHEARHYIDAAAIIDDVSNDNSLDLCREILSGIPLVTSRNELSRLQDGQRVYEEVWALAASLDPEWILVLDADEYFETRARDCLPGLLDRTDVYFYAFRVYDFWDDDHYREDSHWNSHLIYRPLLVRYLPGFPYRWEKNGRQHERVPSNVSNLRGVRSGLRVKHMGWSRQEDRERKYHDKQRLDPDLRYLTEEQYRTILEPSPRCLRWCEEEK